MAVAKTILRLLATCVAGFAGVLLLSEMIAPGIALLLPGVCVEEAEFPASLVGGVVGSLFACLLLVPTAGVPIRRLILCILLSPALAALGICLFVVGMIKIEIVHPWECLALLIL